MALLSDDDNICDEVDGDIVYDANNSDGLDLSIPNINIEEENSFEIRSLPSTHQRTLYNCVLKMPLKKVVILKLQ